MARKESKFEHLKKSIQVSDEDIDLIENFNWKVHCQTPEETINQLFYAKRPFKDASGKHRHMPMHREIMARVVGRPLLRHEHIDHIDCDGLNNRRDNLRIVTHRQNMGKMRLKTNNKSSFTGVSQYKGGWMANIHADGRRIFIGVYKEKRDAVIAYDAVLRLVRGKYHKITIFPDGENPFVLDYNDIDNLKETVGVCETESHTSS